MYKYYKVQPIGCNSSFGVGCGCEAETHPISQNCNTPVPASHEASPTANPYVPTHHVPLDTALAQVYLRKRTSPSDDNGDNTGESR